MFSEDCIGFVENLIFLGFLKGFSLEGMFFHHHEDLSLIDCVGLFDQFGGWLEFFLNCLPASICENFYSSGLRL